MSEFNVHSMHVRFLCCIHQQEEKCIERHFGRAVTPSIQEPFS